MKEETLIMTFLALFVLILCIRNYPLSIDEYVILQPALSVLLEKNFDVDEYPEIHDISFIKNGHHYAWQTPFFGLLFAPFHLIGKNLGWVTGMSRVLEVIPSVLSVIGSMVLIYKILEKKGVKENVARFSAWNFVFGTTMLFYSVTIWRHAVATFISLLVYYGLSKRIPEWKLACLGFLTGYLVMINEVFLALLAFFIVFSPLLLKSRRKWFIYIIGTIPAILMFLSYNYVVIGNPFVTTRMLQTATASWFKSPSLIRALAQLYSPRFGLFMLTPLFALPILLFFLKIFKPKQQKLIGNPSSVLKYILSRPTPKRILIASRFWFNRFREYVFLVFWIVTILVSASTFTLLAGDFSWGARLITEACAPFAILTGFALDRMSRKSYVLISILFLWGFFINVVGTLSETWKFYFVAQEREILGTYYFDVSPFYPIWKYPYCVWVFTLIKFLGSPKIASWVVESVSKRLYHFVLIIVFMFPIVIGLQILWRKPNESPLS